MRPDGLPAPELFIQRQDGKAYFPSTPHILFTFTLAEFPNDKLIRFCCHNRCQKRHVGKSFRRYRRNNSNFLSRLKSLHVRFSKIIFHGHDILPFSYLQHPGIDAFCFPANLLFVPGSSFVDPLQQTIDGETLLLAIRLSSSISDLSGSSLFANGQSIPSRVYLSRHRLLKAHSSHLATAPCRFALIKSPMPRIFSQVSVAPGITGVRIQSVLGEI